MPERRFRNRSAVSIENEVLRLTVLREGGHIAEIFDKRAGISPLWIPQWESVEPSAFASAQDSFGGGADAKLLAGIMGHNLCLDIFGGPSPGEAEAGLTVHGEGSVAPYDISDSDLRVSSELKLRLAQLSFRRTIEISGSNLHIVETVKNLAAFDRAIAWTQHVTLGPPFLDPLTTEFRASVTNSMTAGTELGFIGYLSSGREFSWPFAPSVDGRVADLRRMHGQTPASAYTAHLADSKSEHAYFISYSPRYRLAFGYVWRRADFPWLGIWEENCSRMNPPWLGRELTRGMEFGVSPFPETRREMVGRGKLFGTPTYRWIAAGEELHAEYWIISEVTDAVPESLSWPGLSEH